MSPSKPHSEDVSVISTLALKGVLDAIAPAHFPNLRAEFHATQALLKDIAAGKSADVVILTDQGIAELVQKKSVVPDTVTKIGRSGVGLAVRAGARKPDISSLDALKRTLVTVDSVGHSRMGASGLYFAGLLERLQLADKLKKRVIVERGPVAAAVASGEIALGAQLLCELAPVQGIEIVGPLPDEVQTFYAFSGAVMTRAARPAAAKAFLQFLKSDAVRAEMKRNYLEV